MRMSVACFLVTLILASFHVTAVEIEGIAIPDTITLEDGGPQLVLNGSGIREKLFLDIYIGALYLPARTSDTETILSAKGPASVLMHFLYKKVSKKKIIAAWNDGMTANHTPKQMAALQPRLHEFNALFQTMHKGETIQITHLPGTGTEVRINNELRGTIEGEGFFQALLRIWLGSQPVSNPLKKAMLGID